MTTWEDIVGHDWAVELIRSALSHRRVGHGYLITGPGQVGKGLLARTFAQALNCTAPDTSERPCGRCRACLLIADERHPDVRVVVGELSGRGKLTIKIEQIRQLQRELSLTPAEARHRVAIIEEFDAASPSAANAFLKTLEEPPSNVILILTAADTHTLLPTITSRCRTIALRPLTADVISEALQSRWQVAGDEAFTLARLADGRLGWAVRAAQDQSLLETRSNWLAELMRALTASRVGRFATAERLARSPKEVPEVLRTWLTWWRDLSLLAIGRSDRVGEDDIPNDPALAAITNIDYQSRLLGLSKVWPANSVTSSLEQTLIALEQLEGNANTRLVLENLLLSYPADPGSF